MSDPTGMTELTEPEAAEFHQQIARRAAREQQTALGREVRELRKKILPGCPDGCRCQHSQALDDLIAAVLEYGRLYHESPEPIEIPGGVVQREEPDRG